MELFKQLNANGDNSIDLTALNQQLEETIRVARQVAGTEQNSVNSNEAGSTSSNNINNDNNNNSDQLQQASESKSPAIDELTLDNDDDADDRNKRFLNLGFGGTASGGGGSVQAGGSVAGSGNFLFDIIRLFSGSITPQNGGGDDRANEPSSSDEDGGSVSVSASASVGGGAAAAAGGYTEGIPGPVTRLVVLANRGLANLIQDLILRIAATSERLVNFKARLITALI